MVGLGKRARRKIRKGNKSGSAIIVGKKDTLKNIAMTILENKRKGM